MLYVVSGLIILLLIFIGYKNLSIEETKVYATADQLKTHFMKLLVVIII